MVLAGPTDSPLRQTSREMDLDSPSIWVDLTGRHIGPNKTELRRTGRTCFVRIKITYLNDLINTKNNNIKLFFSFCPLALLLFFVPD